MKQHSSYLATPDLIIHSTELIIVISDSEIEEGERKFPPEVGGFEDDTMKCWSQH